MAFWNRQKKTSRVLPAIGRHPDLDPGIPPGVLYNHACALARVDRRAKALTALEQSARAGYDRLSDVWLDEDLAGLRAEPRSLALVDSLARVVNP